MTVTVATIQKGTVLKFNNRGLPWPQDQQICLCHADFITDPILSDLLTDHSCFAIPKLAIDENNQFILHFSELYLTLLIHLILVLKVTCLYPLTAMTTFNGEEDTHLHKCLLVKTFFRFPQDQADNNYNPLHEPSSDEDDDSEEEAEVIQQVQASHHSQHLAQVWGSSCNVHFASVASTSTPAFASGTSIPPTTSTSATAPTSAATSGSTPILTATPTHRASHVPVNPSRTFDLLKLVPSKPWSTNWSSTPGLYTGEITSMEPKIKQAYMLAVEGTSATGLHLSTSSLDALADQFQNSLAMWQKVEISLRSCILSDYLFCEQFI